LRALSPVEVQLVRHLVAGDAPPVDEPVDWDLLLKTARNHRLGALLFEGLSRSSVTVPPRIRTKLERAFHLELAKSVVRQHYVEQMATAARRLGRPVCLLKGAAFADRLYTHPSTRTMADIDVLVRPDDFASFSAELGALGFESHLHSDHATCFRHRYTGVFIELHQSLTSCAKYLGIQTEALLERSIRARRFDGLRSLSLEDHLLHLSLHASFQHGFRQPAVNAWDAKLLVEQPDFDAVAFVARATRPRLAPWVFGGLRLSGIVFPSAKLDRLADALVELTPERMQQKLAAVTPAETLSPERGVLTSPPVRRLLWCGDVATTFVLLYEVTRHRSSAGRVAFLPSPVRAWQLIWNHYLRAIPLALMKHAMTFRRPTPASLGEVRDV